MESHSKQGKNEISGGQCVRCSVQAGCNNKSCPFGMVQKNSIWAWQMVCLHQGSTITGSIINCLGGHTYTSQHRAPNMECDPKGFHHGWKSFPHANHNKPTTAPAEAKQTQRQKRGQTKQQKECIPYYSQRGWEGKRGSCKSRERIFVAAGS